MYAVSTEGGWLISPLPPSRLSRRTEITSIKWIQMARLLLPSHDREGRSIRNDVLLKPKQDDGQYPVNAFFVCSLDRLFLKK
jgi:hypothetical protein